MGSNTEEVVKNTNVVTHLPNDPREQKDVIFLKPYAHPNPTTQFFLDHKPRTQSTAAGLNPLVDAAAYLFSFVGKLKQSKEVTQLSELRSDLVMEIEKFEEIIQKAHENSDRASEYISISVYALCMTIDDIILTTPWGKENRWEPYSLVVYFNHDSLSPESFLIILERLVRDPTIYIDVMEFLYICLRLGFKCRHASEFGYEQIEQITNSLYKRIRIHRRQFSKNLSPYSIHSINVQNKKLLNKGFTFLTSLLKENLMKVIFGEGRGR